jgi:hypothetical protein
LYAPEKNPEETRLFGRITGWTGGLEILQKEQADSCQDLNISSVKNSRSQVPYTKVHEIDDCAMVEYAVNQIAQPAANDERKRNYLERLKFAGGGDEQQQPTQPQSRKHGEYPEALARRHAGSGAQKRSLVFDILQPENAAPAGD